MPARPTIILTGFGPFPGTDRNATAHLVPRLAQAATERFCDHDVTSEVLPTEWDRAPQRLNELLQDVPAILALHFGVCRSARGFDIEHVSRNVCAATHDAAGALPSSALIVEAGPPERASTFPTGEIIARLKGLGLPARASHNAGAYLCNTLLYHSLAAAEQRGHAFLSGFVHLPADLIGYGDVGEAPHPECPLGWDDVIAGGLEIIAVSLEAQANVTPAARRG